MNRGRRRSFLLPSSVGSILSRPARVPNTLRLRGVDRAKFPCSAGRKVVEKTNRPRPLRVFPEFNRDRFHGVVSPCTQQRAFAAGLDAIRLEALEGCELVDRRAAGIEVVDRGVGDRVSKRDPAEDQFVFRDVGKLANRLAPQ